MTAPDPHSGSVPPPRPPVGPAYPPPVTYPPIAPPPATPEPMSAPPGSFSGPPAPYSVSPAAPAPARRSRGALFAIGVAALALLLAVISLVVAWRAVDQAGDAKQFALAGGTAAAADPATEAPAPPPTTEAAPPPTGSEPTDLPSPPDPSSTAEPAPLDERTVYTAKYERQTLTLRAGCNDSMYIDLDEPRANVPNTDYDLGFTRRCLGDTSNLSLGEGVEASESGSPQMTPHDCAERIRTAPIGTDAGVPVRKGVVLCLTTSLGKAREKGDSQRMVRLEITGVADDGTVTLQSTAWNIPR